ncbi:MAG TPA: DUF2255 family protein [Thermoleophilaceae bacterium]
MAGPSLAPETLDALDASVEVDMLTPRRDGSTSRRPIWVVVADGEAYVRSYRGASAAWYRRALADGVAALEVDGRTIDVELEPIRDADVDQRVSEGYRAKYGEQSPGPTDAMVSPEVVETTLRLRQASDERP